MTAGGLTASGALALWHDYRAGHCAHLGGYSGGAFDGVEAGAQGRFRTGYGFETSHDFVGGGVDASLGYIRVADNPAFYPPVGGMCLIASYLQSDDALDCQIIGQGGTNIGDTSWMLIRSATDIKFMVSDNVALSAFSYTIPAVPGQIETVTVRYTGGVGVGNCTISVISPTPSSSTGQISRVPQDVKQPVSVCCLSNSTRYPFFGVMRYVAFVRGAQTDAILAELAAEIENTPWPDAVIACDRAGSVADRAVQLQTRFGVDASTTNEGLVNHDEISNSGWISGNALKAVGAWRIATRHFANVAAGSPADIQKILQCGAAGGVLLPITLWSAEVTDALAAYGTWDFWVYEIAGNTPDTYVLHQVILGGDGALHDVGYAVRIEGTGEIKLVRIDEAAHTDLILTAAVVVGSRVVHFRVTRTDANVWKLYYQIVATNGVQGPWVYAGAAVSATYVVSDGLFLDYDGGDALLLGNHRSEKALFKWKGVVNPL